MCLKLDKEIFSSFLLRQKYLELGATDPTGPDPDKST